MDMQAAVRPDFFNNLKAFSKDETQGLTDEERHYYSLANHKGYQQFKAEAESLLKELDEVNEQAIAQGLPMEQIGQNAIVVSTAKGIIKRLLNKVEDISEHVEEQIAKGDSGGSGKG